MPATSATLELDQIHDTYWAALDAGRLTLQRCACGQRWLPPRAACPACLGARWTWQSAAGGGRLKSWVIYHVAFHDAFRDRLPYNVALVELDEGIQLITNIVADNALLRAEARVRFVATREGDRTLARFELVP
jgi:uncharacterized OB-fold protein